MIVEKHQPNIKSTKKIFKKKSCESTKTILKNKKTNRENIIVNAMKMSQKIKNKASLV